MKIIITSFYWVPSANGGETPGQPAWHLDVTQQAENMDEVQQLGGNLQIPVQLNIEQATELGFTLEAIGAAFATDAAATADMLRAQLAEKNTALSSAMADNERFAKLLANMQSRIDAATENQRSLQVAIDERDKIIAELQDSDE